MRKPIHYLFFVGLMMLSLLSSAQASKHNQDHKEKALLKEKAWVNKQFKKLSEKERIAQLFMVAAYSNKQEKDYKAIEELIQRYNIGGLIFFKGDPISQVTLTNRYQKIAKTPLLLAMDAEWGLGMRLANTVSYPKQMTLGAIQDNGLIYQMGAEIARQMKLIGVHINFAPVVDVNTNPDNPGIGRRSFGDAKGQVSGKGLAYIKGLQEQGIMAVAKHFPGKGDASKDAHHTLPIILHDTTRLNDIELFPFQEAIAAGVGGVMVSHLSVPAYDATPDLASSLSKKVVTGLLKEQLGFKGLVFTDALNMKAVSQYYQPGEVDLLALHAGNDVLLFPEDVPKAIALIQKALKDGILTPAFVESKVKKILQAKYQFNLHQWKPIATDDLEAKLNSPQAKLLKQQLFEQAITIVANEDDLLPFKELDNHQFAALSIINQPIAAQPNEVAVYQGPGTLFREQLSQYATMAHFTLNQASYTAQSLQELANQLKKHTVVIVDIQHIRGRWENNFGLQKEILPFLKSLQDNFTKVVLVPFGNIYSLSLLQGFKHVVAAYEEDPVAEQVIPQILFGALPARGKLPIRISDAWQTAWGIQTTTLQRLSYSYPEAVGMDSQILQKIDTIVAQAINHEAMPGCQVLVARKGKIVFQKPYGYHTYAKKNLLPIKPSMILPL